MLFCCAHFLHGIRKNTVPESKNIKKRQKVSGFLRSVCYGSCGTNLKILYGPARESQRKLEKASECVFSFLKYKTRKEREQNIGTSA